MSHLLVRLCLLTEVYLSLFLLSPLHKGLGFSSSLGMSIWGPETELGSGGAQTFHGSMATGWRGVLLRYILSTFFFPNCNCISSVVFSEIESLTSLSQFHMKGLSAEAEPWDSAGSINSRHSLVSAAAPGSVGSALEVPDHYTGCREPQIAYWSGWMAIYTTTRYE